MSDEIDSIPQTPATASAIAPGTPDRNGTPFDRARHIAKQHPTTGRWMPKGGRKPKTASGSSGSTSSQPASMAQPMEAAPSTPSSSSPAASHTPPAVTVTADDLLPLGDAPAAPASGAEKSAAAATREFPEIGPGETARDSQGKPTDATPAPSPAARGADVSIGHEVAGELAARVTYAVTGAIIGDHKKATAVGEEHKTMKSAYAAFFQHRGVIFVGTVALLLIIVSYCLGDARREEIASVFKKFFGKKTPAQPVIEIEARTVTPSAPAASVEPQPFWNPNL